MPLYWKVILEEETTDIPFSISMLLYVIAVGVFAPVTD
jgi:hypothetical protein